MAKAKHQLTFDAIAALATDELKTAAREYTEANKVYWAALARHPARNKETQEAHRPIAERNSGAWARCVALLKELDLNELPDRRGFLIHLAHLGGERLDTCEAPLGTHVDPGFDSPAPPLFNNSRPG